MSTRLILINTFEKQFIESISKHVKYVEHFQEKCLIHNNDMPAMYIFIRATWNNKECKIMRHSN